MKDDWLILEDWAYVPEPNPQVFVVSNFGRVGEILKNGECGILRDIDDNGEALRYNNDKYSTIWLCNVKRYTHVMVANCFLDNPLGLKYVNHIDHNSKNNFVTNLEFCDQLHNQRHRAWFHKTKFNRGTLRWNLKSGKLLIT